MATSPQGSARASPSPPPPHDNSVAADAISVPILVGPSGGFSSSLSPTTVTSLGMGAASGSSSTIGTTTALSLNGIKVHPSALAYTGAAGLQQPNPSHSQSAIAAAQHVAAIAAQDLAASSVNPNGSSPNERNRNNNNNTNNSNDDSQGDTCIELCIIGSLGLVAKTLPLLLIAAIAYVFYIYNFRVCVDYILHTLDRPIQAGLYLGIFNTLLLLFSISYGRIIVRTPGSPAKPPRRSPPPLVPPATTPYQPQRNRMPLPRPVTDTTPLLSTASTVQSMFYQSNGSPQQSAQEPVATLSISKRDGRPRWCDICNIVKPDRCHHCSECDQCVLRMDHHCPWVKGCVGYNNHKFFYLFILYASVLAVWVVATMVPLLIAMIQQCDYGFSTFSFKSSSAMRIFQNDIETERREPQCKVEVHWIIMTIIAALLALMIVSFTTAHTVYILNNRTTIESLQHIRATYLRVQFTRPGVESILEHVYGQDISSNASQSQSHMQLSPRVLSGPGFSVVTMEAGEQLWDRGSWLANWKSIMGPSWWLWFVPYDNTPGDGIHEVYNEQAYKRIVTEAISQAAQNQRHGNSGTTAAARDFVIQVPTVNEGAYVSSTHTSVRQEDPAVAATGTSSSQSTLVSGSMMTTDKRHKNGYHQAHQVASTTSIGAFQQYQQRPGAAQQGAYTLVLQEDDDDDDDDSNSDSDAESSVGSMNRSLPTPHSSPRLGPTDHA